MSQAAIAHGQRLAPKLREHGPPYADPGQDDYGPVGLQADDLAPLLGGAGAVELDLPIDLAAVEHGALRDIRAVRRELAPDGLEVRDVAKRLPSVAGLRLRQGSVFVFP